MIKNLKQQDLAALLEISQTALSHIESGKTWPSKKTLYAISEKTNTPLVIIFLMAMDRQVIPGDYLQLIKPVIRDIASQYVEFSKMIKKKH